MLINKESYDATIEETKRTVKNIKSEIGRASCRERV